MFPTSAAVRPVLCPRPRPGTTSALGLLHPHRQVTITGDVLETQDFVNLQGRTLCRYRRINADGRTIRELWFRFATRTNV